ncbi:MAG: uncharacterized protein JWO40_537 [Candidatus Doudnabacteria bacterium]|nr:uncharacterized protein [Candidatus Doudnabacteria bacterium]
MHKVYFAGAITGDRSRASIFKDIIQHIQSLDKKVLTEHFQLQNPNTFLAEFINKKYEDLLPEDIEKQDTAWINEATHLVAEVSTASTGTGREIEYARSKHLYGHPEAKILCLYEEGSRASAMITGMTPERYPSVRVRAYKNLEHLKEILNEFFNLTV